MNEGKWGDHQWQDVQSNLCNKNQFVSLGNKHIDDDCCLLGLCCCVSGGEAPAFGINLLPLSCLVASSNRLPSPVAPLEPCFQSTFAYICALIFSYGLLFFQEAGGSRLLQNVNTLLLNCTASLPRRQQSSY
jgi:hypothetical protein